MGSTSLPDYKAELEPFLRNELEPLGKKLCKLNHLCIAVSTALRSASETEKDNFISSIQGNDFITFKVRLELADRLERQQPILDALKSEDSALIRRALQCRWLFQNSSVSRILTDADFMVNELLPSISYSCRRKLLNRIGKFSKKDSVENVTKIYQRVLDVYGTGLANYLISACNQIVIDSVIEEKKVKFRHYQLLQVYKKYPTSAIKYLNALYQELQESRDKSQMHAHTAWHATFFSSKDACPFVLSYIAKVDPSLFMDLFEKYEAVISSSLTFGSGLTRHLIKYGRQKVLSKPLLYVKILQQTELIKRLTNEEFLQFFQSLMPENVTKFPLFFETGDLSMPIALFTWLDKFALNKRFEQLKTAFRSRYGKDVEEYPDFISARIIEMLTPQERDKWVDYRLSQKNLDQESGVLYAANDGFPGHVRGYWEAFRTTDKSIPKIKEYLATEPDIYKRADLLSSLVLTCSVNNDKTALKEVCQFVSSRFRNDRPEVRIEFLSSLCDHFDLLKLDEDHWKPINELLHISSLNNETFRLQLLENVLEKSIHFRVKRNLPVDTQIQHFIKMKTRTYCRGESWCIATLEPAIERKCLKLFTDHLQSIYPSTTPSQSDSAVTSAIISLFESYCGWNRRNRNKAEKLEPLSGTDSIWLTKRLQDVIDSNYEGNKQRIIQVMHHDQKTRAILHPLFLKSCPVPTVLFYFLRKAPSRLEEFMDQVVDFMLASNGIKQWQRFLQMFQISPVPKLREKFGNKCLEIAEDEDETLKERGNAIYLLSFLLGSNNFVDWISKFYPPEDTSKPETYTFEEEMEVAYGLRKRVAESLCNLSSPTKAIPALKRLLVGDYVKLTIGSLYSTSERSGSLELMAFLKDLATSRVTVKKHAIRLLITISTKGDNIAFLKNLWNTEKHYSIRTILFNRILRFFIENHESWDLLKSCITSLTPEDHPFLSELARKDYILSNGMPKDKLTEYMSLALSKLDEIEKSSSHPCQWIKLQLFDCILPENINDVDETLLRSLFDQHLFMIKDESSMQLQSAIMGVAITYLLYYGKSTSKMDIVTKYLDRLVGSEWNVLGKDSLTCYPAREALADFVERWLTESFKIGRELAPQNADGIKQMFLNMQDKLHKSKPDSEILGEDLFLSFGCIFHSHYPKGDADFGHLQNIGKDVAKLVEQTLLTHKPQIISIFSDCLKRFLNYYKPRLVDNSLLDGSKVIFIIEGILDSATSVNSQIVGTQLLFSSCSNIKKGHKFEDKFVKILNKINAIEDSTVQTFVTYRTNQMRSYRGYSYDILV